MTTKTLTNKDLNQFKDLLEANHLPTIDIGVNNQHFLGYIENNNIYGGIGLEYYNNIGLLRSLVVDEKFRGKNIASTLYEKLLDHCAENNISHLFLLTQTARGFFEKKGWETINRDNVPEEIKRTAEFSHICPSTAICMSISVTSARATQLFKKGFNCAQSVLEPFAVKQGLNPELALRLSTGFGAGMVHRAETCGAVTGAMMALGLNSGRIKAEDTDARDFTYMLINNFTEKFTEKHGSIICKKLLNLEDITPSSWQKAHDDGKFETLCPYLVNSAAKITEEIINRSKNIMNVN